MGNKFCRISQLVCLTDSEGKMALRPNQESIGSIEGRGTSAKAPSTSDINYTEEAVFNELGFAVRYKSSGEVHWLLSALSNTANLVIWVGGFFILPFTLACFRYGYRSTGCVLSSIVALCYVPWGLWKRYQDFFYYGSMNHAKNCSINFEDDTILVDGARPTVIASHPHGCFSMGIRKMIVSPVWNTTLAHNPPISVVATALKYQPFGYFTTERFLANCCAADKYNFEDLLKAGKNICLQPGGFEEAMTLGKSFRNKLWMSCPHSFFFSDQNFKF